MEILITGPFGTIGAHVLARLIEAGHAVTCLDLDTPGNRKKAAALPASVGVVFGDVTRLDDVLTAVRGKEAVVHLAAIIPPGSDAQPALAEKVNVEGTRNVVEAITREAPSAVLVFPSSVSVHGYSANREPPVRIDAPFDGRDNYARQKIACEVLIRQSATRWVILRVGACSSPNDLTANGKSTPSMASLFSLDPETRIEFLHPDDAALAIERACHTEEAMGRVFFLGSGAKSQLTWRAFLSTYTRALGLGEAPRAWFGTGPYYTDWMDTVESERLFGFQKHGFPAYEAVIARKLMPLRVVLTPFRPLVRWQIGRAIAAAKARARAAG